MFHVSMHIVTVTAVCHNKDYDDDDDESSCELFSYNRHTKITNHHLSI